VQSAQDFLEKIDTDQTLKEQLEAATGLETRLQIIRGAGFDFTLDEFKHAVEGMAKAAGQELTPEELQQVAGGAGPVGWGCNNKCPNHAPVI